MIEISRSGNIPGLLQDGKLNYEKVYDNIVKTLSEYMASNSLKTVVIGLSGGLDSTICSAIWREVSNGTGIQVVGYSLPCSTNHDDEKNGAQLAGEEFCHEFHEVNLQELFEKTVSTVSDGNHPQTATADGNIKARLRMLYLYNAASVRGGIVSDQDMLTENMLGFFTINGDVFDISPLSGLWKTEVYELAKWMLEHVYKGSKALQAAIDITPTDGNGVVDGGDMAQIAPGKTYNDVDRVLKTFLNLSPKIQKMWWENHKSFNTEWGMNKLCSELGEDIVDGIISRHYRTTFKRRKHPMGVNFMLSKIEG